MAIPIHLRRKLIDRHNRQCPVCGRKDVPLHVCHIVPLAQGGSDAIDNLGVMCPTCHESFDRSQPSEVEFHAFLADLLGRNPDFTNVVLEPKLSDRPVIRRGDISVRKKSPNGGTTILIECKRSSFFTERRVHDVISQIDAYRKVSKFDSYVLAFPGRLVKEQRTALVAAKIEIWDIDHILEIFGGQISESPHAYFKSLFQSIAPPASDPLEIRLLNSLNSCPQGRPHWSDYQKIVGQIFESLFCPPLDSPISESPDEFNVNRRDWIFPNYADSGFWRFLRESYSADYIVIDAKNYMAAISKSQVLQIANYLKPHGAGMFAIIATRHGANSGAKTTIREQWMSHRKLILVTDDTQLEAMLLARSSGGDPAKVIGQMIQDFRLSM